MSNQGKLIASAVAGLFLLGAPVIAKAGDAEKDSKSAKGENGCKGKDGCKGHKAEKKEGKKDEKKEEAK